MQSNSFKFAWIFMALLPISTIAYNGNELFPSREDGIPNRNQILSNGNNNFSINLYKELIKNAENMVVSPFSIATVLSMTLFGSGGNTTAEIKRTLGYLQLNESDISEAYKETLTSVRASTECELLIANSIWIRESFPVSSFYKDQIASTFDAQECDFNQDNGLTNINQWVKNKTNNKIPSLLNELSNDTVMMLVNAIYFKGPWKSAFNVNNNVRKNFKNQDNDSLMQQTDFMKKQGTFSFHESGILNAKLLELPYTDEDMSMIFVLPRTNFTLAAVENLTLESLHSAIDKLEPETVEILLPKFTISTGFDLVQALQQLGVKEVFTNNADLRRINPTIKLSKAFQKGTVDINEAGAEAAAASGFIFSVRSLIVPKTKKFRATHPFMFFLYHKPTKTIVFMGRYVKV